MKRPSRPFPSGRVLVLAPHPDDETIGCGGALALHHRRGDRVKVVFATDGEAAWPARSRRTVLAKLRRREARAAGRILGVDEMEFWAYPDGGLRRIRNLASRIGALLDCYAPDIVYRPLLRDPHPDHGGLARAFESAAARRSLWVFGYEVWAGARRPVLLDITGVWRLKQAALARYRSQLRIFDYLRMVRLRNSARGILAENVPYAEGYDLTRRGH